MLTSDLTSCLEATPRTFRMEVTIEVHLDDAFCLSYTGISVEFLESHHGPTWYTSKEHWKDSCETKPSPRMTRSLHGLALTSHSPLPASATTGGAEGIAERPPIPPPREDAVTDWEQSEPTNPSWQRQKPRSQAPLPCS